MKQTNRKPERDARHQLGAQIAIMPGVAVASERGLRLVGLAADEDPELGLLGVVALREVAGVCEEHQVARARNTGWTWAQIAAALEVSPQAVHQRHAPRLAESRSSARGVDLQP